MFSQMMSLQNSPTYRRSLAERLEQERQMANNGTIPGGLASMINAGTAAYLRARDEGDRSKAQKALMGGITEATDIGEMGEDQIPAGPDGALYRLGQLEDNPYAGRLSQMLMFEQMQRQQEAEAQRQAFQMQLARDQMNNRARIQAAAAGRSSVNVNTGVPNDPLLEKLAGKQGELWNTYTEQGDAANARMGDLDALGMLVDAVPNGGPIVGRALEMFPEFNDAAAAFMSVVSRIAPQMRVPGSGSTSDKEVEMFLRALPRLRYSRGTNRAVVDMLKAKAQIDIARSDIVAAVSNGEMSPQAGREAMRKLNMQSVMPQSLQALTDGAGNQGGDIGNGIRSMPSDGVIEYERGPDGRLRRKN